MGRKPKIEPGLSQRQHPSSRVARGKLHKSSSFEKQLCLECFQYVAPSSGNLADGHQERMCTVSGPTSRRFFCAPAPLTDVRPSLLVILEFIQASSHLHVSARSNGWPSQPLLGFFSRFFLSSFERNQQIETTSLSSLQCNRGIQLQ